MDTTGNNLLGIEVTDPEILNNHKQKSHNMDTPINLDQLSEADLAAALDKKRRDREAKLDRQRRAYEAQNETFCQDTVQKFNAISATLKTLKEETIKEANSLYHQMYLINGREPRQVQSFTRKSADGSIMITVDYQERIEFTDEALVHINAIKDIFKAKFEKRNKAMYAILDGLLVKGRKGDYDPKLLAKARKQIRDLGDNNLIAEFEKLDACQRVYATSSYCRVKQRNKDGKWEDVNVSFSSL